MPRQQTFGDRSINMTRGLRIAIIAALLLALASSRSAGAGVAAASKSRQGAPHAHAATTATNRDLAAAEASRLLRLLVLPSGAQAVNQPPAGGKDILSRPALVIGSPQLVDRHAWWRVPAGPATVLAFLKAHLPHRGKLNGGGHLDAGSHDKYLQFSWPPLKGRLQERHLFVSVVALRHDSSGVRADAEVVWTVPRPASEIIPRGVTAVDITRRAWRRTPGVSITVTSPTKARKIVGWVNRLEIVQPGARECPPTRPERPLTLSFRGHGGALLAQARFPVETAGACDTAMSLTIRGTAQTPLAGGEELLRRISGLLGKTVPIPRRALH